MTEDRPIYETSLHAKIESEFDAVLEWVVNFNGNGKTYAQFGVEYQVAAKNLKALMQDAEAQADYAGYMHQLGDTVDGYGFHYSSVDENLTADNLIAGHQTPGGRRVNRSLEPPRPHLLIMLRDIEFGNPGAAPSTVAQRVEQGRQHFARLRLGEEDKAWLAAELVRIETTPP